MELIKEAQDPKKDTAYHFKIRTEQWLELLELQEAEDSRQSVITNFDRNINH